MKTARLATVALLFLTLLAALSLPSCGAGEVKQPGERVDTLPLDSNATTEQKIARLTEQLKFSPNNFQLYYDRSLLWYESGNTVQAIADMDRVLDISIKLPQGHHMRGFYAYVQNDDSTALKHFRHAAELGSDDPETYYTIGQIYFFQGQYDESVKWYETAIQMDSLEPQYRFAKAFLLESQGKVEPAIAGYREVLRVDPTFIKALAQLHDLYRDKKKDKAAAMAFNDRIMLIDSTHPIGRFNMGNLFMEKALNQKVAKEEDKMQRQALFSIAISEFSRSLQKDPGFTRAYYNRGYCFYETEKYSRALEDFKKVTELDPYNEKAFFLMGSIYEYKGQADLALASYERALAADPDFFDAERAVKDLKAVVAANKRREGGQQQLTPINK